MKKFVYLFAAVALLAGTARAQAEQITYQLSNGTNAGISITDAGSSATYGSILFNSGSANYMNITSGPGVTTTFLAQITGTFNIVNSTEVGGPSPPPALETASVQSTGGQLTITDGSGFQFIADLSFSLISDFNGTGGLSTLTANLTPVSYIGGSNTDLQALLASVNDVLTLTFQYSAADLYALTHQGGSLSPPSSYSATLTADPVPEPSSFILLGMGSLGMFGYTWRRRSRLALA